MLMHKFISVQPNSATLIAQVISVSNILRMLVTSTKIHFWVAMCRFIKYIFLIGRTMLAIVKAIRLFSMENKF